MGFSLPPSTRCESWSIQQGVGCSAKVAFDPARRRDCVIQPHPRQTSSELQTVFPYGGSASSECAATSWVVHFPSHFHPVVVGNQDRNTTQPEDLTTRPPDRPAARISPCIFCLNLAPNLYPSTFQLCRAARQSNGIKGQPHSVILLSSFPPTRHRPCSEPTPLLIHNSSAGRNLDPTPILLLHHDSTITIASPR